MGTTDSHTVRSSDRVAISIRIRVFGSEVDGRAFIEEAQTLDVSRNGGLIIIDRNLTPEEEIVIRVEDTGKESPAQIVGQIRSEPDGFVYGVKLLEPSVNLWDINFLPLSESERAIMRTLLECAKCHLREVVYLEEYETEVYYAHRYLYHPCKRCRESTIWNEAACEAPEKKEKLAPPAPPAPAEPVPARRTVNERRHVRIKCQFPACIRYKQHYREEILQVNNISRGGVCFNTGKPLTPGTKFDIAIPYSPGVANIFVPAEVVRVKPIPHENLYEVGAAYLQL
jgi:hypothetical protein